MQRLMLTAVLLGSLCACALLATPAAAQSYSDPDYLFGYDVVISDNGAWHDGWDDIDNRVFARVDDRGRSRDYYFSDIASAFFVLRRKHGDPIRMIDLQVGDYAVQRSGRGGQRLLDGRLAWYFWDDERLARGGTPLILAFHSERDARALERYRYGRVLSFATLTRELRDWIDDYGDRCYWRGSHSWSSNNWSRAWNRRWDGWDMDRDRGWVRLRADSRPVVINHPPVYRPYSYHNVWRDRDREWREREERDRYERDRREREERERYEREQRDRERREREERDRIERERKQREDQEKRDRERREREERERREREERQRREREKQIEEAPPKRIQPVE